MTKLVPSTTIGTNDRGPFPLTHIFEYLREYPLAKAMHRTLMASGKYNAQSAQRLVDSGFENIALAAFGIPVTGPGPTLHDYVAQPGAMALAALTVGTVDLIHGSRQDGGGATLDDCVMAVLEFALGAAKLLGVEDGKYEQMEACDLDALVAFLDKLIDGSLTLGAKSGLGNKGKGKGKGKAVAQDEKKIVAAQDHKQEQPRQAQTPAPAPVNSPAAPIARPATANAASSSASATAAGSNVPQLPPLYHAAVKQLLNVFQSDPLLKSKYDMRVEGGGAQVIYFTLEELIKRASPENRYPRKAAKYHYDKHGVYEVEDDDGEVVLCHRPGIIVRGKNEYMMTLEAFALYVRINLYRKVGWEQILGAAGFGLLERFFVAHRY